MISLLVLLVYCGLLVGVLVPRHVHDFNRQRARTSVRSPSGPNLSSLLVVLAVALLAIDAADSRVVASIPGGAEIVAGGAIVLTVAVAAGLRLTQVALAVASIAVLVATAGLPGAVALVVAVALLLWLFGAVRGFFG